MNPDLIGTVHLNWDNRSDDARSSLPAVPAATLCAVRCRSSVLGTTQALASRLSKCREFRDDEVVRRSICGRSMGEDRCRARVGGGEARVDHQVVQNALMDRGRLGLGHSRYAIGPPRLPCSCYLTVALHADPEHRKAAEGRSQSWPGRDTTTLRDPATLDRLRPARFRLYGAETHPRALCRASL